jgi:hypothetical protein
MSQKRIASSLVCGLFLVAHSAYAQVGGGTWTEHFPTFNIQERGCGDVNGLVFTLTCSNTTDDNRAERRYATYTGSAARQFEGSFRITSMGGTRISLKQTFKDLPTAGPDFMMAVESGGRLYAVHGGATISPTGTATVGTTVRVNTIHRIGNDHRVYINGALRLTVGDEGGSGYYDKFGFYRTASGRGPGSVTWSGIHFWIAGGTGTPRPTPTPTPTMPTQPPTPTPSPTPTTAPGIDTEVTPGSGAVTASTNDGNLPGNTVDNNLGTRWSGDGDGQWLKFDLGTTRTVNRVRVAAYNGTARQNRFDIQVSTDDVNWTNVLTGANTSGTSTAEENFDVADAPARWVRYLGHGSSDPTKLTMNSVTEVSIFALTAVVPTPTPTATPTEGPTPTPTPVPGYVEITPSGSAVTASTNDGNTPANTVDNNLSTRWSANGDGQWLRLDLGSDRILGHVNVAVYNGNARSNIFELQVSSDGMSWTTVFNGQSSGTTTAEESYPMGDVTARYVRYLGHMNTVNAFNSVTEVSVFAVP